MRKPVVLLLLLFLFCSAPGPALAGLYATEITQILNHAELVLSYAVQANQLSKRLWTPGITARTQRTRSSVP